MTQKQLEEFPPGVVIKVVVQKSRALQDDEMDTMFVVKHGQIGDWAIYAHTLKYMFAHWDSEYETMVQSILNCGTKITCAETIRDISGCDDEMFTTYRY